MLRNCMVWHSFPMGIHGLGWGAQRLQSGRTRNPCCTEEAKAKARAKPKSKGKCNAKAKTKGKARCQKPKAKGKCKGRAKAKGKGAKGHQQRQAQSQRPCCRQIYPRKSLRTVLASCTNSSCRTNECPGNTGRETGTHNRNEYSTDWP